MPARKALIIDDEPDILQLLTITLSRMGIDSTSATCVEEAKHALKHDTFDICLTDLRLPDGNGLEIVDFAQKNTPRLPIAVISAHGNMETAIDALKRGAFDFVSKPIDLSKLRQLIDVALKIEKNESPQGDDTLQQQLLGNSPSIIKLRETIKKLARSQAPIYISGESGTGKELVARLIHSQGPRAEGPFVPVNCGAIPTELMESEFFGHKKGSFTGAIADKQGLFQAANGGTLFLDEVADLPLAMQVKLLRAIQEKAVRPIGEEKEISINVRILSATHKNLLQLIEDGQFRQDLYYRINVISVQIPSLRERPEDILMLAEFVLQKLFPDSQTKAPKLGQPAINQLTRYSFPGNVRELENVLERAVTLCDGETIEPFDLQLPESELLPERRIDNSFDTQESEVSIEESSTFIHHTPPSQLNEPSLNAVITGGVSATTKPTPQPQRASTVSTTTSGRGDMPLEEYLEKIERQAITEALEAHRWNKTAAAKELGISFRAMRYRLKKLGLD
ncbi:MAG: sigma-54 dependent transcriptional regulator [Pseudomonadota bacterium]